MLDGSDIIEQRFSCCRDKGEGTLIGFITSGDPSIKGSLKLAEALIEEGGIDILELGIPFSDPVADGPVIQASSRRALNAGSNVDSTLWIARQLKQRRAGSRDQDGYVPVIILTYYNPVLRFGIERFFSHASKSGVSGVIVPDLPFAIENNQDSEDFLRASKRNRIATVMMASPSTSSSRLALLISETQGFLYLVSLFGVTGARRANQRVDPSMLRFVQTTSKLAAQKSKNLAVGFGISTPRHVKDILKAGADGVIVGSSFVKLIASSINDIGQACSLLVKYSMKLKEATRI